MSNPYEAVVSDLKRRIKLAEETVEQFPENHAFLGHELYLLRRALSSLEDLVEWEERTL